MMKFFKRLFAIVAFGILALLGIIFWPRIREYADRCLAAGGSAAEPEEVPAEVVDES